MRACLNTAGITDVEDTQCLVDGLACIDTQCSTECAAGDVNDPTCSACFDTKCTTATTSCSASGASADTGTDAAADATADTPTDDTATGAGEPDDGGDMGACEVTDSSVFTTCSGTGFGACITAAAGLPAGCTACFDSIMTCIGAQCSTECADQASDACNTCREDKCGPAFDTCTAGVTP